ncbi:MAG: prepilin-type N-terminal cleavage/methylation domain-containing protein [Bdellovibrionales bacterium]|nr:prepilin-type N-terminal cleavage/methylation domain-containing protein [Bdellovibrionales bacterium]
MKTKGFTLIELILAMLILSILGIYTWISLDASFKTQQTVERFASLYESASAVLEKITLDVGQMFVVPSNQNLTYMIGRDNEISFTSLSHSPLTSESTECEQTEISYKTESNPNRQNLLLLLRNETRFIDGPKEEKEEENFEIVTGQLSTLKLEYSKDGVDYVSLWDTTNRDHENQLPKIVKLTIALKDSNERSDQEDKEVFFETFIDVPMSEFYMPSQKANAAGKNPNNPNAPTPSMPTPSVPTVTNPFGVSGGVGG